MAEEQELDTPEVQNLDQTDFLSQSTFSLPEKEVFPRINLGGMGQENLGSGEQASENEGQKAQIMGKNFGTNLKKSPLKLVLIIGGVFLGLILLLVLVLVAIGGKNSIIDSNPSDSDQTSTEGQQRLVGLGEDLAETDKIQSILVLPQIQQAVTP